MATTPTVGNDVLVGTQGSDKIDGLAGNDEIYGLGGADDLRGGSGDDYINGGDGDDYIVAGSGNDILDGGAGNDTFDASSFSGFDYPRIVNGSSGEDTLVWAGSLTYTTITNVETLATLSTSLRVVGTVTQFESFDHIVSLLPNVSQNSD